jgi:hypothetical protein
MPQLMPFYFIEEFVAGLFAMELVLYLATIYLLPQMVKLFL